MFLETRRSGARPGKENRERGEGLGEGGGGDKDTPNQSTVRGGGFTILSRGKNKSASYQYN